MAQANAPSESAKIPLFYGLTEKDALQPKSWLRRCEQVAIVQNWNDQQRINGASFALRGPAEDWYQLEVEPLENPTWATFKEKFLGFTLHRCLPYRGGQIWPKILNAHKEKTVSLNYLALAKNIVEFNEILPPYVHDDHLLPANIRQMQGIAALSPLEKQAFGAWSSQRTRNMDMNMTAMSVFFSTLPIDAKDFLLARPEYDDLVALKNAVESFIASRSNLSGAVNAIEDVDAIRNGRASTKNAKPDQPRRNITCFYCNKKGHGQQECRKRARDGAEMVKPPPKPAGTNQGQQPRRQGQYGNKVNETSEVQTVQNAFQNHLNHLN
jgi:hypothetical protein